MAAQEGDVVHRHMLALSTIVLAGLLPLTALAQDDQGKDGPEAQAEVGVNVQLKLGLVLEKAGFPVPSDSPMGDSAAFEKTMRRGLSAKRAKKAASLYRWGLYFVSKESPGKEVHVSVLTTSSPASAIVMTDLFLLREERTNKALAKDGIKVVSKKMTEVKPKGAANGYAYERTIQAKDRPPEHLTTVVVACGRFAIEVILAGVKNKKLAKQLVSAAIKAVEGD